MALAIRFLPNAGRTGVTANGRSYGVVGATIDLPVGEAQAIGSDQARILMAVGTTADRPTAVPGKTNSMTEPGMPTEMFDLTLSAPIFRVPGSYPTSWIDVSGAAV